MRGVLVWYGMEAVGEWYGTECNDEAAWDDLGAEKNGLEMTEIGLETLGVE